MSNSPARSPAMIDTGAHSINVSYSSAVSLVTLRGTVLRRMDIMDAAEIWRVWKLSRASSKGTRARSRTPGSSLMNSRRSRRWWSSLPTGTPKIRISLRSTINPISATRIQKLLTEDSKRPILFGDSVVSTARRQPLSSRSELFWAQW